MLTAELQAAHAELAAGDAAKALARLLALWREHRVDDLRYAIFHVGARAARHLQPPRDWYAAAAAGDPVELHVLLASVADVDDDAEKVKRAAALIEHDDPRIGIRLLEFLEGREVPLTSSVDTFWEPLFALFERCRDPNVRMSFSLACDAPPVSNMVQRKIVRARLAKALLRLHVLGDEPRHLEPPDSELARALWDLARTPPIDNDARGAELLANVYAAPEDDVPRAVLADWLQERGDPHGELIALQLAKHRTGEAYEREKALIAKHAHAWLGPIGASLQHYSFRRGFLAYGSLVIGRTAPPHRLWGTVESVAFGVPATDEHPMPALRSATYLEATHLDHLATLAAPPRLEELGVSGSGSWYAHSGHGAETLAAITAFERALPRLPALRTLALHGSPSWVSERMPPDRLAWPWRGTTIRELRLPAHFDHLPAWFDVVLSGDLDAVTVEYAGWHVRLAGDTLEVRVLGGQYFPPGVPGFATAVARLPADHLASIKIDAAPKNWTLAHRRTLTVALDRHPRAALDVRGYTRPKPAKASPDAKPKRKAKKPVSP